MPRAPLPRCWAEGCTAPSASACARCRTAEYCGAPCQRAHWRAHKVRCRELEAAADAVTAAEAKAAASLAAGELPPEAPRTPGVYTGLECRVQDYHCALGGCGAALDRAAPTNALCAGCRAVAYCSGACQLAHWAAHREACYEAVCARVASGDAHQDDEGGEYVLRDRLRVCQEAHGALDERTLACTGILARCMQGLGKLAEAEALYRSCLAGRRSALGDTQEATVSAMEDLASLLRELGNIDEAEALLREALGARRATLGPRHVSTLCATKPLVDILKRQGKLAEAEAIARKALSTARAALFLGHPATFGLMGSLSSVLQSQGAVGGEADSLLREAVEGLNLFVGRPLARGPPWRYASSRGIAAKAREAG